MASSFSLITGSAFAKIVALDIVHQGNSLLYNRVLHQYNEFHAEASHLFPIPHTSVM